MGERKQPCQRRSDRGGMGVRERKKKRCSNALCSSLLKVVDSDPSSSDEGLQRESKAARERDQSQLDRLDREGE